MKSGRFRKPNGQFRRGTLRDFGFKDSDINDGSLRRCEKCKKESRPILIRGWVCECGHKQGGSEGEK